MVDEDRLRQDVRGLSSCHQMFFDHPELPAKIAEQGPAYPTVRLG